jgi:hypothetical protein
MAGEYRFSFGPWNIHTGADPFGPTVRDSIEFGKKLKLYKNLGFDGVQFHDDDAVPDMDNLSPDQIVKKAKEVRGMLEGEGLVAEFVAPRLWEDEQTIDGAYTSNDASCRQYAKDRSRRMLDIADTLDTKLVVLWYAREGTYIREAKDSKVAVDRIAEALNDMPARSQSTELQRRSTICSTITPKSGLPLSRSQMNRWTKPISRRPATLLLSAILLTFQTVLESISKPLMLYWLGWTLRMRWDLHLHTISCSACTSTTRTA